MNELLWSNLIIMWTVVFITFSGFRFVMLDHLLSPILTNLHYVIMVRSIWGYYFVELVRLTWTIAEMALKYLVTVNQWTTHIMVFIVSYFIFVVGKRNWIIVTMDGKYFLKNVFKMCLWTAGLYRPKCSLFISDTIIRTINTISVPLNSKLERLQELKLFGLTRRRSTNLWRFTFKNIFLNLHLKLFFFFINTTTENGF